MCISHSISAGAPATKAPATPAAPENVVLTPLGLDVKRPLTLDEWRDIGRRIAYSNVGANPSSTVTLNWHSLMFWQRSNARQVTTVEPQGNTEPEGGLQITLTLPLLSFGGSAIAATCVAIAILLRIDWEGRQMVRGFKV